MSGGPQNGWAPAPILPRVTPTVKPNRSILAGSAIQAGLILAAFAVAGGVCGLLWHVIWDAPTGVVFEQRWNLTTEDGLRSAFSATGWFVMLSAGFGGVLGVVIGLRTRERELVSLASVVVGSIVAALLMWRIGLALSVPDPSVLARRAADGTLLEGRIAVGGWSPFLAYPTAALFGILVPFVLVSGREKPPVVARSSAPDVAEPLSPGPLHR